MEIFNDLLEKHKENIGILKWQIAELLKRDANIEGVVICGSVGREEIHLFSDLDFFLILSEPNDSVNSLLNTNWKVNNELIWVELYQSISFSEFKAQVENSESLDANSQAIKTKLFQAKVIFDRYNRIKALFSKFHFNYTYEKLYNSAEKSVRLQLLQLLNFKWSKSLSQIEKLDYLKKIIFLALKLFCYNNKYYIFSGNRLYSLTNSKFNGISDFEKIKNILLNINLMDCSIKELKDLLLLTDPIMYIDERWNTINRINCLEKVKDFYINKFIEYKSHFFLQNYRSYESISIIQDKFNIENENLEIQREKCLEIVSQLL